MNISFSLVQKNNEGQGEGLHYLVLNTFFIKEIRKRQPGLKITKSMPHFLKYITEYVDGNTENMNKVAAR